MCRENRGQIDSPRALRRVQSPDALDGVGIHIHGLRPVAPAGCHGQGDIHPFSLKLLRAESALSHAADGAVRNHNLNLASVCVEELILKELLSSLCHGHGLFFQSSSDIKGSLSTIDYRPDSNYRMSPNELSLIRHFFLLLLSELKFKICNQLLCCIFSQENVSTAKDSLTQALA